MKKILLNLLFSMQFFSYSSLATEEDQEISISVKLAKAAILTAILIPKTKSGRHLCAREKAACAGVNQGELGILLLAANNEAKSLSILISSLGYATDAGLSELLVCEIVKKEKLALNIILTASAQNLRKQCENDFLKLKMDPKLYKQLSVNDACDTVQKIDIELEEVTEILKSRTFCS